MHVLIIIIREMKGFSSASLDAPFKKIYIFYIILQHREVFQVILRTLWYIFYIV